jgi:hypothetical protein
LQGYDFEIQHRKGAAHVVPDALSRAVQPTVNLITVADEVQDKWWNRMKRQILAQPEKYPLWRLEGLQLYKKVSGRLLYSQIADNAWKIVVPKGSRKKVLQECHDEVTAGHLGSFKTWKRAAQTYYWPGMKSDIGRYVRQCQTCAQYKVEQTKPAGLMGNTCIVTRPWQMISTDLCGPFPRSPRQNKYLLVITDYFTKFSLLYPLREATSKAVVTRIEEVFLLFGVPQYVRCDNGVQFSCALFQNLMHEYESTLIYNPNYHPQVNPTERVNRVIKTMIASYVRDKHNQWDSNLGKLGAAMRSAVHEVTGYTPNFLTFGREVPLSGKVYGTAADKRNSPEFDLRERDGRASDLEELPELFSEVRSKLQAAYEKNKRIYDLRRRPVEYPVGGQVWKRNFALSNAAANFTAKLAPKFNGPYTVKKKVSPLVYELMDAAGKSIGRWHVKDMKPLAEAEVEPTVE